MYSVLVALSLIAIKYLIDELTNGKFEPYALKFYFVSSIYTYFSRADNTLPLLHHNIFQAFYLQLQKSPIFLIMLTALSHPALPIHLH